MNIYLDKISELFCKKVLFLGACSHFYKWREGEGIEPSEAFTQKPPIRVEACGVHQDHIPPA